MPAITGPFRIKTSTLNAWIMEKIEPIYRASVLWGMMKARGRIKYKQGGDFVNWKMRYMRREINKISGAVTSTQFTNTSTEIPAQLGWSGYDLGESITKIERLKNQDRQWRIEDLVQSVLDELVPDFLESWRLKLWQDGARDAGGLAGILSIFGSSATPNGANYTNPPSFSATTGYDGTSAWWCCTKDNYVSDYGGVSTQLGALQNDYSAPANDVTVNYPLGQFSTAYNFNSPLLIDYNSKRFHPNPQLYVDGSTPYHSWESQWQQACNMLMVHLNNLQQKPVDALVMTADMLARAQNSMISQQRFNVVESSEMRSLGFKSLEYNGAEFVTEYGVPEGMGFAIPFDQLEYRCMGAQLIERSEDKDITTSEDLYKLDTYGQLILKAAGFFGAVVPATATGT